MGHMFADSSAFILGRRTYEIANRFCDKPPINGAAAFGLTHCPAVCLYRVGQIEPPFLHMA